MRELKRIIILFLTLTVINVYGTNLDGIEKTYYVSSSMGDDCNNGLSAESPKCHIKAIKKKSNVRIRLKRDDVFFEQLQDYKNCIFEDYGDGARPVLCGFKVLKNPQAWMYDDNNGCWVLDMQNEQLFTGMLNGDQSEGFINNIGFIYVPGTDKVYGHRVKEMRDLKDDGSFYITNHYSNNLTDKETFRYLRWKIETDPRELGNVCFPLWLIGIKKLNNCEIHNLAIVGFNFAIVDCNDTRVENCQIDLIGGSVQIGLEQWARYGNGIEFTANNRNNIVKDCLLSRTFDCAVSIQSSGNFRVSPKNICFLNNRFYHCRQAFEFFLNPSNDYKPNYSGCSFSDNICYMMGDNEFSSPEIRDASILSYDRHGKDLVINRNVFFGAPYFCGPVYPEGMQNNTVYLYQGQYLSHYHFNRKAPSIYANNKKDIELYRQQSGDNSKIIIIKKGTRKAKRIERKMLKKVEWKPVPLRLGLI